MFSPGHGYIYYASLSDWATQRGSHHGLLEDIHTNEIAIDHVFGELERSGMRVVSCRERDKNENELIVNNDGAGSTAYSEVGTWSTSTAAGGHAGTGTRFATTAASESSVSWWIPNYPADGRYALYAWWTAGTNRCPDAKYVVFHSGGRTTVTVDQRGDGSRWNYLGTFHFERGQGRFGVGLSNASSAPGSIVVADALKFGGGMGTIKEPDRTTGTVSGQPRWKEGAFEWIPYAGAPSSIGMTSDVTIRPHYADWVTADAYIALHTNAADSTGTSNAVGTSTYIHDTNPSAGSRDLATKIHNQIVSDFRALWDPSWRDRGVLTANFGETRECRTMPAALIELAFHDNPTWDARFLRDEEFRRDAGRAIYKGAARYLNATARYSPAAPTHLTVLNAGGGAIRAGWRPGSDPTGGAGPVTGYTVYASRNGRGFDDGTYTLDSSLIVPGLAAGDVHYFKAAAVGPGGESRPTEVLAARVDFGGVRPATLVVQGYDRLDEFMTTRRGEQTFDSIVEHGQAIAAAGRGRFAFDSASNEAVEAGDVALASYRAATWILGNESTKDETFSTAEQARVQTYLAAGGKVFISGSEIGWDLGQGAQATTADRTFLGAMLGARYVQDDAGPRTAVAASGSIFAGLAAVDFGKTKGGLYAVDYPDALAPEAGAATALSYQGTSLAAATDLSFGGGGRAVLMGFPFETIAGATRRAEVMTRVLDALLPGHP